MQMMSQFYCRNIVYNIYKVINMIQKNNYYRWRPMNKNEHRLQFPTGGDSNFYGGVGKKHYQLLYHKSDEYVYNPEFLDLQNQTRPYQNQRKDRKKGNSVELLRAPPLDPRKSRNRNRNARIQEDDSLVTYEKQFDNRRLERNNSVRQPPMSSSQNKIMPKLYHNNIKNSNNNRQFSPAYNQYQEKGTANNKNSTKELHTIDVINGNMTRKIQDNKNYIRSLIKNSYMARDNTNIQPSPNPNRQDESEMKIFSTVQNLYDIVHRDDQAKNKRTENQARIPPYQYSSTRVISPTYMSSIFQG